MNLQAVVVGQPAPGDQVDEKRERLRDRPSACQVAAAPHVARVADDDVGLADVAEELAQRVVAPGVVAVHHHDVIERGGFDTAAVRPAESHVAFVGQQPDVRKAREIGGHQRPGAVVASVVDRPGSRGSRPSGASARVTFSSVARMFSASQYAGMTIESDRSCSSLYSPDNAIRRYKHVINVRDLTASTVELARKSGPDRSHRPERTPLDRPAPSRLRSESRPSLCQTKSSLVGGEHRDEQVSHRRGSQVLQPRVANAIPAFVPRPRGLVHRPPGGSGISCPERSRQRCPARRRGAPLRGSRVVVKSPVGVAIDVHVTDTVREVLAEQRVGHVVAGCWRSWRRRCGWWVQSHPATIPARM